MWRRNNFPIRGGELLLIILLFGFLVTNTTQGNSDKTPPVMTETVEDRMQLAETRKGESQMSMEDYKEPIAPIMSVHSTKRRNIILERTTSNRRYMADDKINTPIEALHCQDLVTPYLTGQKTTFPDMRLIPATAQHVQRFIHLLDINATDYSPEDKYALLYQMSMITLRFFQWDVSAITLLITTLSKEYAHTFAGLRAGLLDLIGKWNLATDNATNFLKQAKIFRPPCIRTSELEGSTKTTSGIKYTKRTPPKTTCAPKGVNCKEP